MNILVVNAGSSTHKLSFYRLSNDEPTIPLWKGVIDWKAGVLKVETSKGIRVEQKLENQEIQKGVEQLLATLWTGSTQVIEKLSLIESIGHRVVHGGDLFTQPIKVTEEVKEQIRKLIPLAPLHNSLNLEGIELFETLFPLVSQIAVFDTTFHLTMLEEARAYPLPKKWRAQGIQRYGFHGISHHYCAERIATLLGKQNFKMVNCHLGNGCSLCAIDNGKSIDTTMGFTPLEGLMMGTRSGSIDPAILLYLMREQGCTVDDLDHTLNFESGLKGIAGVSDMRMILGDFNKEARLAFAMFVFRLKTFIGAMVAAMGGIDVLCFTGGIGENVPAVRQVTCEGLQFLQIEVDTKLNEACQPDQNIAAVHSKPVFVIHTEEEWMIARACFKCLSPLKKFNAKAQRRKGAKESF